MKHLKPKLVLVSVVATAIALLSLLFIDPVLAQTAAFILAFTVIPIAVVVVMITFPNDTRGF